MVRIRNYTSNEIVRRQPVRIKIDVRNFIKKGGSILNNYLTLSAAGNHTFKSWSKKPRSLVWPQLSD